ncbi:MAG: integrase arm-type DNA-binding domain-containing protein [Proteobacteria bacterium]|nr:integrase arm-type DNA-binding domain-containing protein [Pseudomonadota bacterium]
MKTKKRFKAPANKRRLTDAFLRNMKPGEKTYNVWDIEQAGFGVAITPKGTRTFKVTYYHRKRLRLFTLDKYPSISLKIARRLAQEIRAKAVLGGDPYADKVASEKGVKLRDISELYIERHAKLNNKSWKQADNLMKKNVLPSLGSRLVKDITHQDIQNLFDRITRERPVLANQVLAAVSAVLSWATKQRRIGTNVAHDIERNKVKPEDRFLSDEEVKLVWPLMGDNLRLILMTAQRPGEVANMRWQDVDLVKQVWTLPGDPDGSCGSWPGTKSAKTHECPLTDQVITILHGIGPQEHGQVFNGKIPTTIKVWKKLSIPRFRPHHLRATAATGMDELGFTEEHIGRVLNHAQSGVTQSYIRHGYHEQKLRALTAWGNHLSAILEGRPVPSGVVDIRSAR